MATTFVSCPCCGMTVPPRALNFDANGDRVEEPVQYGTFVKVRYAGGDRGIRWETSSAPPHVLLGLKEQLETALTNINRQLGDLT